MRILRLIIFLLVGVLLLTTGMPIALCADTLVTAEAFLDNPATLPGAGTPLSLGGDATAAFNIAAGAIDMSGIAPGAHTLYIRFQNESAAWSTPIGQTLHVTTGEPTEPLPGGRNKIITAEIFIDIDPGEGNGTPMNLAADGMINETFEALRGTIDLTGLSLGVHTFNIRYLDSTKVWSPPTKQSFYVPAAIAGPSAGSTSILTSATGQIDDNPVIALSADDGTFNDVVEAVTLSKSIDADYHRATIRFLDSSGIQSWILIPDVIGDANGDGVVDLTDAILSLQVMAGVAAPAVTSAKGDVNADGKMGMAEAIHALEKSTNP